MHLKSSPPSTACMRQWNRSPLDQVMACRLLASSHYLNQCRLTNNLETNRTEIWVGNLLYSFQKINLKMSSAKMAVTLSKGWGVGWGRGVGVGVVVWGWGCGFFGDGVRANELTSIILKYILQSYCSIWHIVFIRQPWILNIYGKLCSVEHCFLVVFFFCVLVNYGDFLIYINKLYIFIYIYKFHTYKINTSLLLWKSNVVKNNLNDRGKILIVGHTIISILLLLYNTQTIMYRFMVICVSMLGVIPSKQCNS